MAVVRKSSGEGGSVVEGELGFALGQLELLLEGIDFGPVGEDVFFLGWEVRLVRHYCKESEISLTVDVFKTKAQ